MPIGSYAWCPKDPQYLANSGIVTLTGSLTACVEMELMRAGDCNGDNVVNSQDFITLQGSFGMSVGQAGYDDHGDMNGDRVVTANDFSLLMGNLGQGGAPPISP
jgi:hypothetical protein